MLDCAGTKESSLASEIGVSALTGPLAYTKGIALPIRLAARAALYVDAVGNVVGGAGAVADGLRNEWNAQNIMQAVNGLSGITGNIVGRSLGMSRVARAMKNADIDVRSSKKVTNLVSRSADDVNAKFVAEGKRPPYTAGTNPREFVTGQEMTFVRVYGGDSDLPGGWMMRAKEVRGLTATQIRDKFALPEVPTHIGEVVVPVGTPVRVGFTAPQSGWGSGGAIQYQLLKRLDDTAFTHIRSL